MVVSAPYCHAWFKLVILAAGDEGACHCAYCRRRDIECLTAKSAGVALRVCFCRGAFADVLSDQRADLSTVSLAGTSFGCTLSLSDVQERVIPVLR